MLCGAADRGAGGSRLAVRFLQRADGSPGAGKILIGFMGGRRRWPLKGWGRALLGRRSTTPPAEPEDRLTCRGWKPLAFFSLAAFSQASCAWRGAKKAASVVRGGLRAFGPGRPRRFRSASDGRSPSCPEAAWPTARNPNSRGRKTAILLWPRRPNCVKITAIRRSLQTGASGAP
jgi:hypothetical protein